MYQRHNVSLAVINRHFAFTFGEFVQTFPFLAKKHALIGGGPNLRNLLALFVLLHFHARATQHHGSFECDHLAREMGEQFALVVPHGIRLNQHGLVTVGFFGPSR